MYRIEKTLTISASHKLSLDYDSQCNNLHGHNWRITVICESNKLDGNEMVTDFSEINSVIKGWLDHKNLNDALATSNPTAENIACWIFWKLKGEEIPVVEVDVEETEGNCASYIERE